MAGGNAADVANGLRQDGTYDAFMSVVSREYNLAFGSTLSGESIPFALPTVPIPRATKDFTTCQT